MLSLRLCGSLLFLATIGLAVDAMVRPRSSFDVDVMRQFRRVDFAGLEPVLQFASDLTGSFWAITIWALVLAGALATRRWLDATALLSFPVAGGLASLLRMIVQRARPDSGDLSTDFTGVVANHFASFPSGHVVSAVLLYGFIFLAVRDVRSSLVRLPTQAGCVAIIVLAGPAQIWLGGHWVGDVAGAYTLGGFILLLVGVAYTSMKPTMSGIPLIRATPIDHDHHDGHGCAHALTSTLLFRDGQALKMYRPGFVPRLIYWLAYQAPFAYECKPRALDAAVHRRNLAGMLTEYWYGSNRVSPALGWHPENGHLALVSRFVDGHEPRDLEHARQFLLDLADKFDQAGLPTWQIDPRQPRSLGNILETAPGSYTVIDLESGLVSPVASPRAWGRALKRGLFPLYDDVFFDITRDYVERERAAMESNLGSDWVARLLWTLDEAERATSDWHRAEPRIWSRSIRAVVSIPSIPTRLHHFAESKRHHADAWMDEAIARWRTEGRISPAEAQQLHASLSDPGVVAMLPHFGVHLAIGVVLRFPIGSITRASYTLLNLLITCGLLMLRRIDRRTWQRRAGIHAPWVVVFAAMPGVGTFAYLSSVPVLSHFLLARVAADAIGEHLPFKVYRRIGLKRIVARRPHPPLRETADPA
jgi:undecaprenyl-diphosphatase